MTTSDEPKRGYEGLKVLLVVAFVVAGVGFVVGTRTPELFSSEEPAPTSQDDGVALPALSYTELQTTKRGPNVNWKPDFERLTETGRAPIEPGPARDEARSATLHKRAERRAYDGAPPTIPHSVDQQGYPACLTCHGEGATFDGRTAPRMSHDLYVSCTQCHVAEAPLPTNPALSAGNSFVGTRPEPTGARAWDGAPPVIPHTTFMRSDCLSCHGPHGADGMRSTHQERQSCLQCHATQRGLEQQPELLGHPARP